MPTDQFLEKRGFNRYAYEILHSYKKGRHSVGFHETKHVRKTKKGPER